MLFFPAFLVVETKKAFFLLEGENKNILNFECP